MVAVKRKSAAVRSARGWAMLAGVAALLSAPLAAQVAVVQPVPAQGSTQLNAALGRLAANPRDVGALIDAGNAAMSLGDTDAALGFYAKADQLSPGNPRVKAALASAMVRNEDPFEAIPLFDAAERTGASIAQLAADRGLAYDLVGDNVTAQRYYRQAGFGDPEVARRLALSLAIAGDRKGAEATILPQIQRNDRAGWRTRAFLLAILGDAEEAVRIAYGTMPRDLADAMAPYLRYMPRLTPAQQAAAANFGHFPRAAQIGRDDPRVARYAAANPRPVRTADAALAPQSAALGGRTKAAAERKRKTRDKDAKPVAVAAARPASTPVPMPTPTPAPVRMATTAAAAPPPVRIAAATPNPFAAPTQAAVTPAPVPSSAPIDSPAFVAPAPAPSPAQPTATIVAAAGAVPSAAPTPTPTPTPAPLTLPTSTPAPVVLASASSALGTARPAQQGPDESGAPVSASPTSSPAPAAAEPKLDLAAAFSDFRPPADEAQASTPVVDLAKIAPAKPKKPVVTDDAGPPPDAPSGTRRVTQPEPATSTAAGKKGAKAVPAKDAKPTKAAPSHPSRIWVQIGVGRNKDALAFDWRKANREAAAVVKGRKAWTTPWGATNRLLVGPFDSQAAASAFLKDWKKHDADAFVWTSPAGQAIDALAVK